MTEGPGHARKLATTAIAEGFEAVVAAGGDGTINEVLNGIAESSAGTERVRLGVLPLGTVNVFARELGIPMRISEAWAVIRRGRTDKLDLPKVEYASSGEGGSGCRFFAQLAGAGLDARAIELVSWSLKKKIGPLAYVLAGLSALREKPAMITVEGGGRRVEGELVLIGNGCLYGGSYRIFPNADLRDGLLEACVFPRANWATLARCGPGLLIGGRLRDSATTTFQAESLTLTASARTAFEVDGELVGVLPAKFSVRRSVLQVLVP